MILQNWKVIKVKKQIWIGIILVYFFIFSVIFFNEKQSFKRQYNSLKTNAIIVVNEEKITIGRCGVVDMKMPKDGIKHTYDNKSYLYKEYDSIEAIEQECEVDFLNWENKLEGVCSKNFINIIEKEMVSVNVINTIEKPVRVGDTTYSDLLSCINMHFMISEQKEFVVAELTDESIAFGQSMIYDLEEQYWDDKLETTVVIVRSTHKMEGEEADYEHPYYYAYFVKDNICYQIDSRTELENFKKLISTL